MTKDYYSILGINRDASQTDVKAAYRKLALKFHPDKNPGDPFFEQMFRDLKDAYETLYDPNKRSRYDAGNKNQKATAESRKTRTEPNEPSPTELVNSVISNLRLMINQTKGASTEQIKTGVISDYLNRILIGDIINLYQFISTDQKRDIIFSVIPLLRFFDQNQRNKYATQLVVIAGSDNQLIEDIDKKIKSETSKQKVKNTTSFLARNWRLVGIVAFIAIIYFAYSGDNNSNTSRPSRTVIIDGEPETNSTPDYSELERGKKPSKWKGNHLKTGDSPYNHYFGQGVYNKNYENRVKIHNGQGTDVVVCLTQYNSPYRTIRNEYIRTGESFEMTSIPNGTYYLKSFFGNDWNPDTLFMGEVRGFFETGAGFSKSDNYSDLLNIEQNNYQYSIYEITLYPVVGGNMESEPINANEFFK
ncbi:J domain-containing protein [uncultured Imperialibacter sp.]|uniref:J domain-containing protein n=1 Tax=uncultured Imperialibacter sp. TaxID=1672639 RepID=UPI0030DD9D8E|tara:strand:- start:6122 stop:7372 length:1251 start_codon:yes stop_codon:yes gene_type:complete